MTAVLDLSMMFAAAAIGIAPPGTRWISEHLVTRRRREALHALERTAAADSTTACLVADTARAARRRHAQDETRTPIGTTVHGTYRCDAAGSVLTFDPNHPICSSAPIRAPDPGRPPSWSITRCRGVLAEVTNEADDILAAERRFYCGSTIMSRRRSCGGAITPTMCRCAWRRSSVRYARCISTAGPDPVPSSAPRRVSRCWLRSAWGRVVLFELYQVPAGVVEHGGDDRPHVGGLLGERDTERA